MTQKKGQSSAELGVIGMGVMGRSLALNVMDRGFEVAVWNRDHQLLDDAVRSSGGRLQGCTDLAALVKSLKRPRRVLLMITAGKPVDLVLADLVPLLEPGDVVVDGGNSWFEDTRRRERELAAKGLHFVGLGVSGGEEGARHGPSLMPGGSPAAYAALAPLLEAIAARTDAGLCVTHVGPDGAGHFVKMVHNGLEYADMQLLAEGYHLLAASGLDAPRLAEVFARWNRGPLESFLVEISAAIFQKRDPKGSGWLVDRVLDRAEQKGTGRWTVAVALEQGVAVPSIAAALDGRVLSSRKAERVALAAGAPPRTMAKLDAADVESALYGAKIAAYAQGFELLRTAALSFGWPLDLAELARIWKGGCIIRAAFLDVLRGAFARGASGGLLSDPAIRAEIEGRAPAWRRVVAAAVQAGLPVPALSAGLSYVDAMTSARLPQNLVQAQRDAFGAHTFLFSDDPEGRPQHVEWLQPE